MNLLVLDVLLLTPITAKGADVHQFPIAEIEKCITDGQETIKCAGDHTLQVNKLAPDISMDDFERIPYA